MDQKNKKEAKAVQPQLSNRFEQAFLWANQLHGEQTRKGKLTPYISHLMGVAALVLEDGGDEDEAIAALLHDAVEDQGGMQLLAEIRSRFGERVATIVEGCTDAFTSPKPPWRERKERYLQHLEGAPADVRRVSLADKVHNARSILVDLRQDGERVWQRFNGGKEGTLWYYRSLVERFQTYNDSPLVGELSDVVKVMEQMANSMPKP